MNDLISALADAIVALNNASPRSPTKAEIEAVLREHFEQIQRDAEAYTSKPRFSVNRDGGEIKPLQPTFEELCKRYEYKVDPMQCVAVHDCQGESIGFGPGAYQCSWSSDGEHHHNAYNIVDDTYGCACGDKVDARTLNARAPTIDWMAPEMLPCPGSSDGLHAFLAALDGGPGKCWCCGALKG